MSTAETAAAQRARLRELGLRTDRAARRCATSTTYDDATAVAALAPWTRFAATLRAARRHRLTRRVAAAFQDAVTRLPGRQVELRKGRRSLISATSGCPAAQAEADAPADVGHGERSRRRGGCAPSRRRAASGASITISQG